MVPKSTNQMPLISIGQKHPELTEQENPGPGQYSLPDE